ncbi:MAG: T9SS type A sorting domain-containing protein [Crocinitomicaceae bacterium]|nr:T9SS type A sorting domain-containing protein [Crocinitomicaceae bacterium]
MVSLIPVDSVCADVTTVPLAGTPPGGIYSGPGVTGNNFDASVAGAGSSTVIYTFTDSLGCANNASTDIIVNPLPMVSLNANAVVCVYFTNVPAGTPLGGTYSGPGVTGNNFDPSEAGLGIHSVTYTFTDSIGCTDIDVQDCASISENSLDGVSVYPNPATTVVSLNIPEHMTNVKATLYDSNGKRINAWNVNSTHFEIGIQNLSSGMYLLKVHTENEMGHNKIIKE